MLFNGALIFFTSAVWEMNLMSFFFLRQKGVKVTSARLLQLCKKSFYLNPQTKVASNLLAGFVPERK